jgi:hypothetical protein
LNVRKRVPLAAPCRGDNENSQQSGGSSANCIYLFGNLLTWDSVQRFGALRISFFDKEHGAAMADSVLDQIVDSLRNSGTEYFPEHSELRTVRVVGHTPKPDHYTYEVVLDFANTSERVSAKVYRAAKAGARTARELAQREFGSLRQAYDAAVKSGMGGIPRPVGDFAGLGAVVSTKINGLPLQSIVMKAALLPDYANDGLLDAAARKTGQWLRQFHDATARVPQPIDSKALSNEIEKLCVKAQKDGLAKDSIESILDYVCKALAKVKKPLPSSAVLNEFVPLNVMISEHGVGFCEFASFAPQGPSLQDAAIFLAAVEALEKYPFCNRSITSLVQDSFVRAYGVNQQEQQLLTVLKLKVLLQIFAQGRAVKESALRKKVMWANVMKRFIQHAAERSMAPAA